MSFACRRLAHRGNVAGNGRGLVHLVVGTVWKMMVHLRPDKAKLVLEKSEKERVKHKKRADEQYQNT